MSKTVAVLGNGDVGVALGKGFVAIGCQVVFGTRDAANEKSRKALAAVPEAGPPATPRPHMRVIWRWLRCPGTVSKAACNRRAPTAWQASW